MHNSRAIISTQPGVSVLVALRGQRGSVITSGRNMKTPSVKWSVRWTLTCTSSLPTRNPLVRAARSHLLMLPFFDFPFLTASEKHEFNNPGCSRKCILERNPFLKKIKGRINVPFKRTVQQKKASKRRGYCSKNHHPNWTIEESQGQY